MADTPTTQQSQYEGTSTPPNGGQVDDTGNTPDNDTTSTPQSASSTQPASPATPNAAPQQTPTPQTPQNQNLDPNNPPQGKTPDLSKSPNGQFNNSSLPLSTPPAVQKASIFHDVAETLAGGPRYTYTTDAYGNTKQQKVPVSNAHLALAIAMEALSGGITGLAQKGPNAQAEAAAAGLAQGNKQADEQKQADQQARQQASADFTRKMQVTETNMRMYSVARQVGRDDLDANQKLDAEYAPQLEYLQKTAPGVLQGPIASKDFAKYNVTADNAIPYKTVRRIDPNTGEQAVDARGIPQWDHLYYVVDPKQKLTNLFTPQDIATGKEAGILPKNIDPDILVNNPVTLGLYLNKKSQIAQYNVSKQAADTYFGHLDTILPKGDDKGGSFTRDTLNNLVQKYAKDANIDPKLVNAVIEQESQGNPGAVSPTGATGLMQLTGTTAKQFGVTDRTNPDQNIKAGTQYYAQLLNQFKDPRLAYAAYYSGPGAIKDGQIVSTSDHTAADTTKQADHFAQILQKGPQFAQIPKTTTESLQPGPNGEQPQAGTVQGQLNPDTRMNVQQWTAKVNPKLPQDLEAFHAAVLQTPNQHNYSLAIGHMFKDNPDAAGNVLSFLGGQDAVNKFDTDYETQVEMRKVSEQEKKSEDISNNKQDRDEALANITQSYTIPPDNFTYKPEYMNLNAVDLEKQLRADGVKIPTNFPALYKVAKYQASAVTTLPARTWQKGAPNEMDSQTGKTYITRFINPEYDEPKYATAQKVRLENASGNYKNGAAIQNAGTAANHLELLRQAGEALSNGNIQGINRIANELGIQVGQPQPLVFKAIAEKVNQEVEKVAAGGTTPYKDSIENGLSNIATKNSPAQLESVIKAYTGLLAGRLSAIDYNALENTDEHLNNVHPAVTQLMQRYGFETPWAGNGQQSQTQSNPNQNKQPVIPGQRPNETPVYVQGKVVGFTMPGKNGMRPVPQAQ
jgi:hypothetical protein